MRLLIKANIEYTIEEYKLCLESFNDAISNIEFSEVIIKSCLQLATVCSEWDNFLRILKAEEKQFLNKTYNDEYINNFIKIYNAIENNISVDIEYLINSCKTNKEKSIFLYLIIRLNDIDNKDIKIQYCKLAIDLWENNLAAAEYLFKNNESISLQLMNKLVHMNKVNLDNSPISKKSVQDLDFEFLPLGGGHNIGASSYYLRVKNFNAIIDAGILINGNDIEYPNYNLLDELDVIDKVEYLIITHAHLDHCGAMLELCNRNKNIKILMTRETKELVKLNIKTQVSEQDELNRWEKLLGKTILLNFNEELYIKNVDTSVELYRAGHILGAASVMIRSEECKVLVTGDFCIRDQHTVKGMQLPLDEDIDVLITESTYGNKKIDRSAKHEYILMQDYIKNMMNKGKRVLIPAFSIGRAQEVLSLINNIEFDERIRVYIDGSAISATKLYEALSKKELTRKGNYYVNDEFYASKQQFISQEILTNRCCIVTSSGMLLEGSASSEYAKLMLQDEDCICILSGYQAFNTVGARLKEQMDIDGKRYIMIDEKQYNILCELNSFNMSAHSTINEIIAVQLYLKSDNVILVHGDYKGKSTLLESKLREISNVKIFQSINNEVIKL